MLLAVTTAVTESDPPTTGGPAGPTGRLGAWSGPGIIAVTVVAAFVAGSNLWFFSDDWNIFAGWPSGRLLEPFNSHLSLVPIGASIMDGMAANHGVPNNADGITQRYGGVVFSQFEGAEMVAKKFDCSRAELDQLAHAFIDRAFVRAFEERELRDVAEPEAEHAQHDVRLGCG